MRNAVITSWDESAVSNYRFNTPDLIFNCLSAFGNCAFIHPAAICHIPSETFSEFHDIISRGDFNRVAGIDPGFNP